MTRYIVKLTEQEELNLRQLAIHPGFEVLLKLLQMESLDSQTAAIECTDPDRNKRLMMLGDAQATAKVVSNLTRKLSAYREQLEPAAQFDRAMDIVEELWNKESN